MSNNIDNRVVQMDFDNAKFERGVRTTLESLTKLKGELDMTKSAKSMQKLTTSDFNLKGIEDGIDRLTSKFSTAGIVWQTIVQRATNAMVDKFTGAINQIKTGGMSRAANIEQANFMLEGLLSSKYKSAEKRASKLEEISTAAMNSVDGTAYGYDEASKAAAQFYASGITNGKDMERTLLGVAGTAAMTGRDYGDIARIFTTVSGQGRLMGEQLNQLAASGINAAATLADHLGVTEKEVREMTSKGEIDFKTFAEAMSSAFGEHAKEANKTFNGALSNMKAAMNRIGAEFYTPYRVYMRNIFNAFTPVLNAIKKMLTPVIAFYDKGFKRISRHIVNFLGLFAKNTKKDGAVGYFVTLGQRLQVVTKAIEKMRGFRAFFNGVENIVRNIGTLLAPIGQGFEQIFGVADKANNLWRGLTGTERGLKQTKSIIKSFKKDIGKDTILSSIGVGYDIANLAKQFEEWTKTIKFSDETLTNLKDTFAGLFAIVDIFAQVIGAVFAAFSPGTSVVVSFADAVLAVTGSIGRAIVEFDNFLKATGALSLITTGVQIAIYSISTAISFLLDIFAKVITVVSTFVDKHINRFIASINLIKLAFTKVMLPYYLDIIREKITRFAAGINLIKTAFTKVMLPYYLDLIREKIAKISFAAGLFYRMMSKVMIPMAVYNLKTYAKQLGEVISEHAKFAKAKLPDFLSNFAKSGISKVGGVLKGAAGGIGTFFSGIDVKGSALNTLAKGVAKLREELDKFKRVGVSGMLTKLKSIKLSDVLGAAKSGFSTLGAVLKKFGSDAKTFYDNNLAEKLGKAGEVLKKFAKALFSGFSSAGISLLKEIAKGLGAFFKGVAGIATGKIGPITKDFMEVASAIKKFAKGITRDDLVGALSGLASAIILFDRFKQMKKKAEQTKSMVASVKGMFDSISSTVSSYKKKNKMSKPKAFQTIASGLLILSGALYVVSKVPKDRILPSLAAMGAMALGLVVVAKIFDKVIDKESNFLKVAKSVVPIAASLLMMGEAFKAFGSLKGEDFRNAMIAMGVSFVALATLVGIIGNNKAVQAEGLNAAVSIMAMGMAMKAVGKALLDIATAANVFAIIDEGKMLKIGGVIAGIIGMMSIFALAVTKFDGGKGAAGVFLAAAGMIMLAKAISTFLDMIVTYSNIKFSEVGKGIAVVVGLMVITGAWAAIVGKFAKYAVKGAASIYILAGGLIVLFAAMKAIGKMSTDWTAWPKTIGMLLMLVSASVVFGTVGKYFYAGSKGILVMAASLALLTLAMEKLNEVPFAKLVGMMLVLVGGLTLLMVAMRFFGTSLAGGAALFLIAAGLAALAMAIGLVAAIPIPTIAKSILALGAALTALIVAVGLLGIVAGPGLLLVGIGLAAFGLGVAALTWGLTQLIPLLATFALMPQQIVDKGLETFSKIIEAISDSLKKFGEGVISLAIALGVLVAVLIVGAVAVKNLGQGLLWVAGGIAAIAAAIWLLEKVTGLSFAEITSFVTNAVSTVWNAIVGIVENSIAFFEGMVSALFGFFASAIEGFLSSIPIVGDELAEKFDGWADGIKEKLKGGEGEEAGKEATQSVAKGIEENKDTVSDAMESIGGDGGILGGFKDIAGAQGEESGLNFTEGFTDNLNIGNMDPSALLGGDLTSKFGGLGTSSADSFGGNFESALGSYKVDGSGLARSAAKTASQPKVMQKPAKENVKAYAGVFDKDKSAKASGERIGENSAKGAKNRKGMFDAGGDNASGFSNGVASPSALKSAYDAGWKLGKKAEQGERDASKSRSPSRVFIELGKYLSQGLAIGITRYSDLAKDAAFDMTEGTTREVKSLLDRVSGIINERYDFNPTITPVIDLSNVETGVSQMSSMISSGSFGLSVPSAGIRLAENISADIQNGGKTDMASSINRLARRLESVTDTMNSRSMTNYFQVDGGNDPNAFADAVSDRLKLKARAV